MAVVNVEERKPGVVGEFGIVADGTTIRRRLLCVERLMTGEVGANR